MTLTVDIDLDQLAAAVAARLPAQDADWPMWMDLRTLSRYTDTPVDTLYKSPIRQIAVRDGGKLKFERAEVDAYYRSL